MYERQAVVTAARQLVKVFGSVVILAIGLVLLWQTQTWERQSLSHEHVPKRLSTELPQFDEQKFMRHVKTRLPMYREVFKEAGGKYGLSWILLAAQAYQESHWNRNAKSPTGVRGLMMLTRDTASDMGIENRLDPRNSITGGARYLARLYEQVPENVHSEDRMLFALAAYNVGMGHVKDAQILAKRLNKDHRKWDSIKTVLPLLAKKKYYKTLPNRYARGWEPVQYVKRIRAYRKILEYMDQQHTRQVAEL
ncbi:MAG: transglycosylase SLT domain-containing protein [Nitrospirales bacterium]|nr:transglycosylase SLT domain-containing protein [Nitrospira sp.]MDR4502706.1 transglycosylase SLT domain-containing protein [Nitrospirales bacterium]